MFHQAVFGNFSLKILLLNFHHVSDLISYILIKNTDLSSKISLSVTKLSLTLTHHILETHTLSELVMWIRTPLNPAAALISTKSFYVMGNFPLPPYLKFYKATNFYSSHWSYSLIPHTDGTFLVNRMPHCNLYWQHTLHNIYYKDQQLYLDLWM
jgi:hypothetical protein